MSKFKIWLDQIKTKLTALMGKVKKNKSDSPSPNPSLSELLEKLKAHPIVKKMMGKKSTQGQCALFISDTQITLAVKNPTPSNAGKPVQNIYEESIKNNNISAALKKLVEKHKIENMGCKWVLSTEQYKLTTIDKPQVEEKELRQAAFWSLKDMIDFDQIDALIDIFEHPKPTNKNTENLFAVIAQTSKIQPTVELINKTGLILEQIDICELTLNRLCIHHIAQQKNARPTAMLYLKPPVGVMIITVESTLHMATRIPITPNINETVADKVALTIQRALDFFERQYGLGGVSTLLFAPLPEGSEALFTESFKEDLSCECMLYPIEELVETETSITKTNNEAYLSAGGTLP